MDFLSKVRLLSIPIWVKVVIWALLLATLTFNIHIGISALEGKSVSEVEAAAHLLSITFPILLLALLLSGVKTGQKALKQRTQDVLQLDIPRALARIEEESKPFRHHTDSTRETRDQEASVWLNHTEGDIHSDYAIRTQTKLGNNALINLRVEINVKRANVGIMLNSHAVTKEARKTAAPTVEKTTKLCFNDIHNLFPHSISAPTGAADDENESDFYEYQFNRELSPVFNFYSPDEKNLSIKDFVMLVGVVRLPPAFLWDPSERLFFSQDLTLMLRSMLNEKPHLFEPQPTTTFSHNEKRSE